VGKFQLPQVGNFALPLTPEGEGLENIGTPPNPTVDEHRHLALSRVDDFWQTFDRRAPTFLRLPPWFDTMIPSTPCCTQSAASSRVSMPLSTSFSFVLSFSRTQTPRIAQGRKRRLVEVQPSNIGLRRRKPAQPGWWQLAHRRVSFFANRASVSVFRPAGRSTVRTSSGQPARSARFTSACVIRHVSVG
jgi:hypothetical protein